MREGLNMQLIVSYQKRKKKQDITIPTKVYLLTFKLLLYKTIDDNEVVNMLLQVIAVEDSSIRTGQFNGNGVSRTFQYCVFLDSWIRYLC